jgi:dTMP kinase
MGWSQDASESFRIFQGKVLDEYEEIVEEHDLHVIEATESITDQQRMLRSLVARELERTPA